MKSLLALAILAAMSLCGLADKLKRVGEDKPANTSQSPAKGDQPAKQDREAVLLELVNLEKDITQAAFNGDITLLVKNTTDDFELTGVDGKVQNKNQALADVKKETRIKSWKMDKMELVSYNDDTAVMTYVQIVTLKTGQTGKAKVTDTFVKRDGRWLVKSEQATMMK